MQSETVAGEDGRVVWRVKETSGRWGGVGEALAAMRGDGEAREK